MSGKPVFDTSNDFQAELPVEWTVAPIHTEQGQRAAVCFRLPNTTFTIVLAKDALDMLRTDLGSLSGRMNGLILPGSG